MGSKTASFRVGRVRAYRRGQVWYLAYSEHGQRRQPRVGSDRDAARQMAAEISGQLEVGAPGALSIQPISIPDVRPLSRVSDFRSQHVEEFVRFLRTKKVASVLAR